MERQSQRAVRFPSKSDVVNIPKNEPESDSGLDSSQYPPTNQFTHMQQEYQAGLGRPTTITPIRPRLAATYLEASSSASSTISSVFSINPDRPETPLTPPSGKTKSFDYLNHPRVEKCDDNSRRLFVKKGTRRVSITGSSFRSAAAAGSPSRPPAPDVPIDKLNYKTGADTDELASCLSGLSLESSPVDRQVQKRRMLDEMMEKVDDILDSEQAVQTANSRSNLPKAAASQERRLLGRSRESRRLSRSTVDPDRPNVDHSKSKDISTTPIVRSDTEKSMESELKVSVGELCTSYGADESKVIESRFKDSHERSKSTDLQGISIHPKSRVVPSNSSSKMQQVDGRSTLLSVPTFKSISKQRKRTSSGASKICFTPRKTRSRSTGSIPETSKVSPPASSQKNSNDELKTVMSAPEMVHASSGGSAVNPFVNHRPSPNHAAVTTERVPRFERYKEKNLSKNELKLEVLRVLRRDARNDKKPPKPRRSSDKIRNDIWHRIWAWMWKNMKKYRKPSDGFVYVFKCKAFPPGYLKIGQTSQPCSTDRLKDWDKKCKVIGILIPDPKDKRFTHYDIVEKIVHAELINERKKYFCSCKVRHLCNIDQNTTTRSGHEEWFHVGEGKALEVIEKWRRWVVQMRPYKRDGSLRACWRWKHDQAMKQDEEIDWVLWQKFTWLETIQCCLHCLGTWIGILWPAGGKVVISTELMALGLAVALPIYVCGLSLQSCAMFLIILVLYLLSWFNYS